MNLSEWCKLKRDNENLSEEDFAVLAWNKQRESVRAAIMKQEQEKFEKQVQEKIESELDKNIDSLLEKALLKGKSSMNININI